MVTVKSRPAATGWICEVDVESAGEHTHHTVTVSHADLERWARAGGVEELVRRSFEFLLERESPRSILRRFDLDAIQGYFPEYDREIRR